MIVFALSEGLVLALGLALMLGALAWVLIWAERTPARLDLGVRELEPGVFVVALSGGLDEAGASRLQACFDELRERASRALLLDLSALRFVDSTGLGFLVREQDARSQRGSRLLLVAPTRKVRIVLDMLGLGAALDLRPTLAAALEAAQSAPDQPAS